jgi:hypothetical protein
MPQLTPEPDKLVVEKKKNFAFFGIKKKKKVFY